MLPSGPDNMLTDLTMCVAYCRYQGFTFLGVLNTWIPLPVRWFAGWTARWWGQASSMLGVSCHRQCELKLAMSVGSYF